MKKYQVYMLSVFAFITGISALNFFRNVVLIRNNFYDVLEFHVLRGWLGLAINEILIFDLLFLVSSFILTMMCFIKIENDSRKEDDLEEDETTVDAKFEDIPTILQDLTDILKELKKERRKEKNES